jgi:predicted GNAT superfamily acetyltransferase
MSSSSIEIRPVTDVADVKQLEEVQLRVWNAGPMQAVPGRILHAMHQNGACLIGAFDGGKLVGFVCGILGTVQGLDNRVDQIAAARLQLYSVIMGVLPEYQRSGIGYRLKIAQREFALRIGVRLVTWTYDPLESLNGYFNINKLGAICHTYLSDYYGEMGGINVGLPTDRFYTEWWVTSNRVKSRVSRDRGPLSLESYLRGRAAIANECVRNDQDLSIPQDDFLRIENSLVLVEIPSNFQQLKSVSKDLALQWREHSREVFTYYFDRRYLVTDFVRSEDEGGFFRSYYVLTQASGLSDSA